MFRRAKPDWQWTVHRGVRATPLWKPIARLSERVWLRQRRERQIVDRFHRLYYYELIWRQTRWLGSHAMLSWPQADSIRRTILQHFRRI